MKQRAFSDLLGGLKKLGISSHPSRVSSAHRDPIFWLSTPSIPLRSTLADELDNIYFALALRLDRLRESSQRGVRNPDISGRDASAALSSCEHLYEMASEERQGLKEILEAVTELFAVGSTLQGISICSSDKFWGSIPFSSRRQVFMRLKREFTRLSSGAMDIETTL